MHAGKNIFEQVELNGVQQTLWPKHGCPTVKGYPSNRSAEEKAAHPDESAEFHDDLDIKGAIIFQKGKDPDVDSYSGFFDNGRRVSARSRLLVRLPRQVDRTGRVHLWYRRQASVHADVVALPSISASNSPLSTPAPWATRCA